MYDLPPPIGTGPIFKSSLLVISLTGASQQLIAGNPKRVALTIAAPNTGRITVTDAPVAVLDQGITMLVNGGQYIWTYWTGGEWIRKPLNVISSAGGSFATVIEVFVD
jgi:hypothetical protein